MVVEEREGELSRLLGSACSLGSWFGAIEEHLLWSCEMLHSKPTAGRKCVCTRDFVCKLADSGSKQSERQRRLKQHSLSKRLFAFAGAR